MPIVSRHLAVGDHHPCDRVQFRPSRDSRGSWKSRLGLPGPFSYLIVAGLAFSLMQPGCATQPTADEPESIPGPSEAIPSGPDAVYSPDGLVQVPVPQLPGSRLYVKPPRPHLQRYDKMVLAATTLTYRDDRSRWSKRREDQMLGSFEADLLDTLEAGEFWERADRIGDDTLILKATVAELDLDFDAGRAESSSSTSFVEAGGGAVLGFEIFDSMTQEPLMRFVSRRRLPGGVYSGNEVEEQRLRRVFQRFARDLGELLQAHYRAVREIERRESEARPSG